MANLNNPEFEYVNECMTPILITCPKVPKPVAIFIIKL